MTTRKNAIIEKIQALMARANHPTANEHEAVACAAKAAELMQKYGVESSDLQEKATIEHTIIASKQASWIEQLAAVIRDAFHVEVINMNKQGFMFIGESVNLEVVTYVFDQLRNKIDQLSKVYAKEWFLQFSRDHGMPYETWTGQYRNTKSKAAQQQFLIKSFAFGVCAELRKKMVQPQNVQVQQSGLVLIKNQIKEYTKSLGLNLHTPRTRGIGIDGGANQAGQSAGQNMNINSGLGSKTGQKLLG